MALERSTPIHPPHRPEDDLSALPKKRKAIPPARDLRQSRVLTVALAAALAAALTVSLHGGIARSARFTSAALFISALFASAVWLLRAATPAGALSGGAVCLLLTLWTEPRLGASPAIPLPNAPTMAAAFAQLVHTGLTPLLLLFLCTFLATRSGRRRKAATGVAESRRGRRASQVLANLAAAALCASACGLASQNKWHHPPPLQLAAYVLSLAALAEATADTVSSEIGQAFGGVPRMLLTLRAAPIGTDGAITLLGTASGIAASLLIAFAGGWSLHLSPAQAGAAAVGGIVGLFADSLLGATVEQLGWLGNDLVNFSSTLIAALASAAIVLLARL